MSKKLDRLNQIATIVREKNGATVKELAAQFRVSEMTIRRDLSILESRHIINNVYGAAIYNPSSDTEVIENPYSLSNAKITKDSEKSRIGNFAASLINEEDVVIIDTGSTTEKLAMNINDSLHATILCFNINILNSLVDKENIKIIVPGGYFHHNTQMFESREGILLIKSIRATKVFVSAAGIHEKLGITCAANYEVPTKSAIMQSAVEKILLADSSKFGVVKSSFFADLSDFQMIVTDSALSDGWIDYINKLGIKLIMV
ncbi:DeoR/GlpR family DNA-binding transcription regulator [Anaerocolumna xylanovorans]|uniref:Transcriptional regulator, DeoR family n=1 Tax=Anaerocolumna xylanovorans DSM 12503 TaxID=1121345 RepID=A0A1M7YIU9_9FIRM|nr:DeoR/GlpR family DNA-binding transcription regulator [Anaerocolumna xylanovorans]SHO52529.1 transcriptional regulator, DeoR family [Anaerocolumna xylanovorans DSM 12503]